MNTNGSAIKALRERSGWKVGKFATAVGISSSYLSNIEAGRKKASPDVIRKIADTLDVPLAAVITGHDVSDVA